MFSEDAAAGLMDHSLHRVDSQSNDSVYGQMTARLMKQRASVPFCANIICPAERGIWDHLLWESGGPSTVSLPG